jgi:hypothetical protein
MTRVIIFVPRELRRDAQTIIDDQSIEFETHIWRKGVPDPPITDFQKAIRCGVDNTVTHLMLWGDLTTAQARALTDGLAGCVVYPRRQWRRKAALADMGLKELVIEEQTRSHHMEMPIMHKIFDLADAPFDYEAIGAASDKWDGHTCSLKYDAGALVWGREQGDSTRGLDRTERLATMVPATVNRPATMQVEGEVITNRNHPRFAHHAMTNATDREFARYQCKFIAFDVRFRNTPFTTWTEAMTWLGNQGFDTVLNYADPDYPKDGIVYRIDNNADFAEADIPMFALKFQEAE